MSPCELLFARLKTRDLHAGDVVVGKKNFPNVLHLVEESLNKVPKALVVMFWHHVLLEAFNYLLLQPI